MKPGSKISPRPIVASFHRTLADADGTRSFRDYGEQYGVPLAVGVGVAIWQPEISTEIGIAILTVAGLFAAFLFQLTIQLLDRAAAWSESRPIPGPATSSHAVLLGEISADAAYASLVASGSAVAGLASSITRTGSPEIISVATTAALLTHLATTLLLVLRRVFLLTTERLNEARTGSSGRRSA